MSNNIKVAIGFTAAALALILADVSPVLFLPLSAISVLAFYHFN